MNLANAYAADGTFAAGNNSGTSTWKDKHRYYDYNISLLQRRSGRGD